MPGLNDELIRSDSQGILTTAHFRCRQKMKPKFPTSNQQKSSLFHLALGSIGFLAAGMGCYSAQAATLYAAEGNNINKFASDGTKTSFITTGLSSPRDLAVDLGGNLFVADQNSVFKYTPGGIKTTVATFAGINVSAIAVDATGNLFVASNSSIFKYTSGGTQTIVDSRLAAIQALAVDADGNLFAGDFGSGAIFKYTPGGVKTTFADGSTPFIGTNDSRLAPISLAFGTSGLGKSGNLAALDRRTAIPDLLAIENFLPSGASRSIVGAGLEFSDLAVDENDNVFVSQRTLGQGGASTIIKYIPGTNSSTNFATATGGVQFSALAFDFSPPGSATAVPEPFTIVGTLLGGTAAMRMRKKVLATTKE
jgi:hypothetical protein